MEKPKDSIPCVIFFFFVGWALFLSGAYVVLDLSRINKWYVLTYKGMEAKGLVYHFTEDTSSSSVNIGGPGLANFDYAISIQYKDYKQQVHNKSYSVSYSTYKKVAEEDVNSWIVLYDPQDPTLSAPKGELDHSFLGAFLGAFFALFGLMAISVTLKEFCIHMIIIVRGEQSEKNNS